MNLPAGPTRPLAECLPPDKARQLIDLLRSLKLAAPCVVEVHEGSGQLLGYFVPAPAEPDQLLDPGSNEFWAEMRRRVESNEPAIPAEEVLALFPRP
jgi:hypothetical protein